MAKHLQTIRQQKPTNCFSVFDHFVRLPLTGLNPIIIKLPNILWIFSDSVERDESFINGLSEIITLLLLFRTRTWRLKPALDLQKFWDFVDLKWKSIGLWLAISWPRCFVMTYFWKLFSSYLVPCIKFLKTNPVKHVCLGHNFWQLV